MLDSVLEDARSLSSDLGAADKQRLASHLEHLHEIQQRLDLAAVICDAPPAGGSDGSLHGKTRVMADLLATAVSCSLTRVFTFMLTSPATTHAFSDLGVPDGMHKTCHDGHWDRIRSITQHQMEAFGIFLDAFAAHGGLEDGTTLLDQGLVYRTSEYGEGWKDSVRELPVVLAGGANGALARGAHLREPGANLCKAQLTAFRALGLPQESWGFAGAETRDGLAGAAV